MKKGEELSSILYQFRHPWHWLTYGQNAAALQALCALFALIGLFFYTLYTRRMMKLGELTRRASITPVFTANDITPDYFGYQDPSNVVRANMTIRNVGEGTAILVWAWHQPVSDKFSLFDSRILVRQPSAPNGYVPKANLMKGDSMDIYFNAYDLSNPNAQQQGFLTIPFPTDRKWLFVIDALDQAGGRHQLKLLTRFEAVLTTEASMVHALGDTFGEKWMHFVARVMELVTLTKAEISRPFK